MREQEKDQELDAEDSVAGNEEGDLEVTDADIDSLQKHGINQQDIKKLKVAGICTVKGIQMTTRKRLAAVKGSLLAKSQNT